MKILSTIFPILLAATVLTAGAGETPATTPAATPAAKGAQVYIISPVDGATVSSPVKVVFGLRNMGVAPAGVERQATGHHHLLIDVDQLPDPGKPITTDDHHRHFGGGQTEAMVELTPGEHTLQLLLGDHYHIPHNPPVVSNVVTITVE